MVMFRRFITQKNANDGEYTVWWTL